jgi:hypothetical protein
MWDIEGFIGEVDKLQGFDPGGLARLLDRLRSDTGCTSLRRDLTAWLQGAVDLDRLSVMARETPTHFVWPLHRTDVGFTVMINEFKSEASMGEGYSRILHNHRYSFASLMLVGGYTEQRSIVTFTETGDLDSCIDGEINDLSEGDVATVDHADFHRLVRISDRTMTLLLKSPAEKPESVSIDRVSRRVMRHSPVEVRLTHFLNELCSR